HYLDQMLSFLPLSTGRRRVLVVLAGVVAIVLNLRLLLYDPPSPFSLSWLNELYLHLTEAGNPYGPRDFLITTLTALAWWRGLALNSRRMDMKDTGRRFQIGLVVVLPLILLI